MHVRGYELDSFGHVNHAVYLNYLEHARWSMLAEVGITHAEISRRQLWPVIASIEIKYVKPAFMGDELEVRTQVVDHTRIRFSLEQSIFRGDTTIAVAKIGSAVIDATGRPVETPPEYLKLWSD